MGRGVSHLTQIDTNMDSAYIHGLCTCGSLASLTIENHRYVAYHSCILASLTIENHSPVLLSCLCAFSVFPLVGSHFFLSIHRRGYLVPPAAPSSVAPSSSPTPSSYYSNEEGHRARVSVVLITNCPFRYGPAARFSLLTPTQIFSRSPSSPSTITWAPPKIYLLEAYT